MTTILFVCSLLANPILPAPVCAGFTSPRRERTDEPAQSVCLPCNICRYRWRNQRSRYVVHCLQRSGSSFPPPWDKNFTFHSGSERENELGMLFRRTALQLENLRGGNGSNRPFIVTSKFAVHFLFFFLVIERMGICRRSIPRQIRFARLERSVANDRPYGLYIWWVGPGGISHLLPNVSRMPFPWRRAGKEQEEELSANTCVRPVATYNIAVLFILKGIKTRLFLLFSVQNFSI